MGRSLRNANAISPFPNCSFYLSSHFISKRIAFSYLALRLSRCRDQIRLKWQAHQQLPAAVNEIHETLEYLFGAGFSADEIFECIYIVSYPKYVRSDIFPLAGIPMSNTSVTSCSDGNFRVFFISPFEGAPWKRLAGNWRVRLNAWP